ncbi:MAG: glycosyltransferase family 2 protein [Desulfovibrio aminophilus]|jgi:hypothetical protein|uniref:glycosyltransferase family 2 protein n=1 Tax=Desulfovibrio aminophilus TaxID=81425 RepID=UPI0003FB273C|nr:hypothetical protein [Desulfovibrio aminophilus]MDY0305744.1 hypothetical protein [Desulfovibrionaceae bacterium]
MRERPSISVILVADGRQTSFQPLMRSLARQASLLREVQVVVARGEGDPGFPPSLLRWGAILPCRDFVFLETGDSGQSSVANAAVRRAEGEALLLVDSRHRLLPGHLETCLDALKQGAHAAYTDRVLMDGNLLRYRRLPDFHPDVLRVGNPLGRAVLLRRELWEENGGLSGRTRLGHWEMWIRATLRGKTLIRVPRPLLCRAAPPVVTPGVTPVEDGRHEALLVIRNPAFFPDTVVRWALALLRGEPWALPAGPGRAPNERQTRLMLENAPVQRTRPPAADAPDASELTWDRFLPDRTLSA